MAKKKMIPCRVCGKMFEPCAYCQSHDGVFRWRNFACSIGCAERYVNEAIESRNGASKKTDGAKKAVSKTPMKRNISKTNEILTAVVPDENNKTVIKDDKTIIKKD